MKYELSYFYKSSLVGYDHQSLSQFIFSPVSYVHWIFVYVSILTKIFVIKNAAYSFEWISYIFGLGKREAEATISYVKSEARGLQNPLILIWLQLLAKNLSSKISAKSYNLILNLLARCMKVPPWDLLFLWHHLFYNIVLYQLKYLLLLARRAPY